MTFAQRSRSSRKIGVEFRRRGADDLDAGVGHVALDLGRGERGFHFAVQPSTIAGGVPFGASSPIHT